MSIVAALIIWRFIMGVGIGGDYPLSAVIASEFASKRSRGRIMTTVFAAQGWGNFGTALTNPVVRESVTLKSSFTTFLSSGILCCATGHPRVQRFHHRGQLQPAAACGLLLAYSHRPGLRSRRYRPLFPTHHPRDPTIYYGYRTRRAKGKC